MSKPDRTSVILRMMGADRAHDRRVAALAARIEKMYDKARNAYLRMIAKYPSATAFGEFDARANTALATELDKERDRLTRELRAVIEEGQSSEWLAANNKQDALVQTVLKTSQLTPEELARYEARNLEALKAFQSRKEQGMNLSRRVWNITDNFYKEMELAVDVALGDGRPATELSRDVRQLLKEPNRLYRRVRDKYGNLNLSKAAALYHPGRGVYRSSAMNAMRLARTEVNMAYRTAEFHRWQKMDFVVGIRIGLSNNHTVKDRKGKPKPLHDICDKLAGDYPKTFKFVGWHPHCRCVVTPILKDWKEVRADRQGRLAAVADGREYRQMPSAAQIRNVPPQFNAYIADIRDRAKGWSNTPYYIRDNFRGGDIEGGLKPDISAGDDPKPPPQFRTVYSHGTGEVRIHEQVNPRDGDFNSLEQSARHLATKESTATLTPKLTRSSTFDYNEIYGTLNGTPYYGKCPDIKVEDATGVRWYEQEGFKVGANPKRAFRNMINRGLKQSDRIIISRPPGMTNRYMLKIIEARIRAGQTISEVIIAEEDGTFTCLYKK